MLRPSSSVEFFVVAVWGRAVETIDLTASKQPPCAEMDRPGFRFVFLQDKRSFPLCRGIFIASYVCFWVVFSKLRKRFLNDGISTT